MSVLSHRSKKEAAPRRRPDCAHATIGERTVPIGILNTRAVGDILSTYYQTLTDPAKIEASGLSTQEYKALSNLRFLDSDVRLAKPLHPNGRTEAPEPNAIHEAAIGKSLLWAGGEGQAVLRPCLADVASRVVESALNPEVAVH